MVVLCEATYSSASMRIPACQVLQRKRACQTNPSTPNVMVIQVLLMTVMPNFPSQELPQVECDAQGTRLNVVPTLESEDSKIFLIIEFKNSEQHKTATF